MRYAALALAVVGGAHCRGAMHKHSRRLIFLIDVAFALLVLGLLALDFVVSDCRAAGFDADRDRCRNARATDPRQPQRSLAIVRATQYHRYLHAAEQDRPDVARARWRWIRKQGMLDPARLVFIDETATSTNMVRLRGRCSRGERLVGSVPPGHWKTITLVAGLRHDGMVALFVIDGPMNGVTFLA